MFEMTASAADMAAQNFAGMYTWGLSVIRAFQSAGNPVLTVAARFFSLLGDPFAYMLILPVLFWCIDEKRGFKIGLAVFLSSGLNVALKETFRVPRPFIADPSVKLLDASGFSTPSGHAQGSATFWPLLFSAFPLNTKLLSLSLSFLLPLCIGLSRIYLGVHYPTDVFLGWAIGAAIAIIAITVPNMPLVCKIRRSFAEYAEKSGRTLRSFKLAVAALIAMTMNAFSGSDSSMGGVFFGFTAGYILCTDGSPENSKNPHFSAAAGTLVKKALRLAVGLSVLALLYLGLKKVFPGEESVYYTLFRFVRYGIIGFWASWGAPKLFIWTGLQ